MHTWNKGYRAVAGCLDIFLQTADSYKYDPSPILCSHGFFLANVYTAVKKKRGKKQLLGLTQQRKQNTKSNQNRYSSHALIFYLLRLKKQYQRVLVQRVDDGEDSEVSKVSLWH